MHCGRPRDGHCVTLPLYGLGLSIGQKDSTDHIGGNTRDVNNGNPGDGLGLELSLELVLEVCGYNCLDNLAWDCLNLGLDLGLELSAFLCLHLGLHNH